MNEAKSTTCSADIFQSKIVIHPLQFQPNEKALKTLLTILKTCFGPYAKLKMIQNFAGSHVTVTSSSSRLLHTLPTKNLIVKFITSAVNSHLKLFNDGGVYCSLLILNLLESSSTSYLKPTVVSSLYQKLWEISRNVFNSFNEFFAIKVDVSKLNHLKCVVKSVILSKPACLFKKNEEEHLTLLIIKSFINSIPESNDVNQVILQHSIVFYPYCNLSPLHSKLFNGLLLKSRDSNSKLISHFNKVYESTGKPFKLAIFSVDLAEDCDCVPGDLESGTKAALENELTLQLRKIAVKLICDGAEIVFCQKGIQFDVRRQLEDNGLLVFERLGVETATNLQHMTGSVPVTSLSDLKSITYGFLTSFETHVIGDDDFVLVQNEDRPFQTVLLCSLNEEALAEIKVVCQQALDTLYRLAKDPNVCCGGGCTDICLSHIVRTKVFDILEDIAKEVGCKSSDIIHSLGLLQNSLVNVALSLYDKPRYSLTTEKKYGHLWELENNGDTPAATSHCKCGRYSSSTVSSSDWLSLNENTPVKLLSQKSVDQSDFPLVVDELSAKVNASMVAFETASSLLRISLFIISDT